MAYIKFYPLEIEYFKRGQATRVTYPGKDREFDKTVIAYMEQLGYSLRHKRWEVHSQVGSCRVFIFSRAK